MKQLKDKSGKIFRGNFRMTPEEHQQFLNKFNASGAKSKSDFIVSILLNQELKIKVVDVEKSKLVAQLSQLKSEINSIGNNINQIARIANSYQNKSEFSPQILNLKTQILEAQNLLSNHKSLFQNLAKNIRK